MAALLAGALLVAHAPLAEAFGSSPASLKNRTQRDTVVQAEQCGQCHTVPGGISSTITGSTTQLVAGGSTTLTVTSTGGTNTHKMGVAIATSAPNASPTPLAAVAGSTSLTYFSDTRELIHDSSLAALHTVSGGSANYTFSVRNPAGAAVGSTMTIYAVARIGLGTGTNSGWDNAPAYTITTIPSGPTSLTATTVNSDAISLSWSGGSGPRYRVLRKTGSFPSSNSDPAATIVRNCASTGTSFSNTGLAPNTTYFYRVYACDSGGTLFSTGSATDSAATKQTQTITFGAQTSPRAYVHGGTFTVSPAASTTSDQTGNPTGLAITYTGSGGCSGTDSVAPFTMSFVSATACTITASQAGNASYDAATSKIQNVSITAIVPAAPTGLSASPAVTSAQISFTPPTNTGGTALTGYTASCTPAGSGTASGGASSITVTGLAASTAYSCSVRATNSAGNSAAANIAFSTDSLAFTSANNTTFTVLQPGTFQVTAISTGNLPIIELLSGTLPAGVTFVIGVTPRTLSGTPASGTSGTYNLTFRASSQGSSVNQSFTLTVNKIAQAITWNPVTLPNRTFGNPTFTVTATGGASGSPVVFTSATPAFCSASGGNPSTITILGAGDCTLNANQAGGTNHNAAPQVQKTFTIAKAAQSITFNGQANKPFVSNGTFLLNPVPSASSGLGIATTSNSSGTCSVSGNTVTMLAIGDCEILANQAGNQNYNAAIEASQTINIVPNVPAAPTIGVASPGNGSAMVNFDAPVFDGGSPILDYRATCNTGNVQVTGATSPITVAPLTNNQLYTCSVQARNAVGFSLASATVNVTPAPLMGATLWTNTCQQCHGDMPANTQLNGAGTTGTVLAYVRLNQPLMLANAEVQALSAADLDAIAVYIADQLPQISEQTKPNQAKSISVGSHIRLNTVTGSFTGVETVTPPAFGTLSAWNGTSATYTPNPGYSGPDWFSYRGKQTTPTLLEGDVRTVLIDVTASALQLTVSRPGAGAGSVISYLPTPGIACGADCEESYVTGTVVLLGALADPGSVFAGWGGDCAVNGTSAFCQLTVDAARNVTATFDLASVMFALTASRNGTGSGSVVSTVPAGGIDCGADCAESYASGTVVTLVAAPDAGSAFAGWSGACAGTGACQVTMDTARSVTATFNVAAVNFLLTVDKTGAGTGTVTSTSPAGGIGCGGDCTESYAAGTLVTLAAVPTPGSMFTGWGGDCGGTGACSVTMSVARSVSAAFAPLPPGDFDNDGIPNDVELTEGRNPLVKDNDVFTASPATNRLFAMQLYRDFLSREGDPAGIQGWTDFVTNGTYSRLQVIDAFLSSQEFAGFVAPVVRLYFATFLRVPDYEGLTFNAGLVRNGTVTVVQLADFFTVSPEFQATYGALDNTQFVTLLYNNVLNRAPDPAGLAGWVGLLQGGYTRGQVLVGFSDSAEFQANTANEVFVTMMYAGMLRRTPEPNGFNGWVGFLDAGTLTRTQVINGFFLSTEYHGRFLP